MIVIEVGSEQGETCKGIIMSFFMYGGEFWNILSKNQYSILHIRDLFDNNVLYFLTETIENFIIGTRFLHISDKPNVWDQFPNRYISLNVYLQF